VVTLDADGDHLASRRFGDGCVQWGLAIAPAPAGLVVGGLLREGSAIDLGNGPFLGEASTTASSRSCRRREMAAPRRRGGRGSERAAGGG
jgi:hypothetical protein